jgi:hypothetical protein
MKKIVICGDSFNVDDPDYPNIHWSHHLQKSADITNLSIPGASNLVIRLQLDRAVELQPDLIIINFTSSLRANIKYQHKQYSSDLLTRFNRQGTGDLISFPYAGAHLFPELSNQQRGIIKDYIEFVDLDLARAENYYLIKNALDTVKDSGIKFAYSLGGFDHKSFIRPGEKTYSFSGFGAETPINLWDHYKNNGTVSPVFHVSDQTVHLKLAEYYAGIVNV